MGETLFRNIRVIDGSGEAPFAGEGLVQGNRIKSIARRPAALPVGPEVAVVDGGGATLMPGLVESHAHASFINTPSSPALGEVPPEEHTLLTAKFARMLLDHGFTALHSAASAKPRLDVVVRNAINAGDLVGPRILAASLEMTVTSGLGDVRLNHLHRETFAVVADGPDEFRRWSRFFVREGADTLKINPSGDEGVPGAPAHATVMTDAEVAAVCDVAHHHDKRVAAHARSADSVKMVLRHGGQIIYHATLADEEALDMLEAAKDRVFVAPTIGITWAAYKERGALNKLLQLGENVRKRGVIAASAGNHAQGLSYHGTRLGVPVTIVMPTTTPTVKVTQTQGHGATVVQYGEKFDDAYAHARELEKERGLTFVHPFDHPHVAAGQGTVALEMLEDVPELDTLIVPIGGGGLLSGMGTAARGIKNDMRLVGVQAELYPSMYAELNGVDMACEGDTLAEGIAVKEPGAYTRKLVAELNDDIVLVAERHLERAVSLLLQIEKTVVEGAGAAGLAAMLAHPEEFAGRKVGLVLTGGNIDTRLLANVLLRDLARSGRIARLRIRLQDRPGALFKVMKLFDEKQVNIIEIYHQRIFTTLPAKGLITDIECEARDREHLDSLVASLRDAGYMVTTVELA